MTTRSNRGATDAAKAGGSMLAVFSILAAFYLLSGSGLFHIVDEVSLFSVTESVSKRAAFDTNAIAWTQWVNSPGEVLGAFGPDGDVYSKKGPAPAILAVPFYLIGYLSGQLSPLQTALWFNIFVTAITGLVLIRTVLALGYRRRTAIVIGLLYGLGTIAWPYANHFFGEPISSLAILGSVYSLIRLRQTGRYRHALAAGLMAGVMVAASVAHAVLLLPLGICLLAGVRRGPSMQGTPRRPLSSVFVAGFAFLLPLAVIGVLLLAYNQVRLGTLFTTGYHFDTGEGFTANWLQGLWGLLFSPYRGFFWYTPLALASILAWPGFARRHRAEGALLAAIALILVALFAKWWMWWGGYAWGPRFLVPLAPIVVLVLAPWVESVLDGAGHLLTRILFWLLAILSVSVQLLAVSANYVNFETLLRGIYPTDWADPLRYGPPALFNPVDSPVIGQIRLLLMGGVASLDIGWIAPGAVVWVVPVLALLVLVLAFAALAAARSTRRLAGGLASCSLVALLVLAGLSAGVNGSRPEYGVPGHDYAAALSEVERRADPSDAIITVAPYHYQVPMARYSGRLPIFGYATESIPLHQETESVLDRSIRQHERLWLITEGLSPADPTNGVEAWLAERAFKAEDQWFDDARLVLFVTAEHLEIVGGEETSRNVPLEGGVTFDAARLSSATLTPGGALGVELVWHADEADTSDLRGFVQLLSPAGVMLAGQDGVPGAGYAPRSEWIPGTAVRDNRGLLIPSTLSSGHYRLIAGLYDGASGQRLRVVGEDGSLSSDAITIAEFDVP